MTARPPLPHSSSPLLQRYFEVSLLMMMATSLITLAATGKLNLAAVAVVLLALVVKLRASLRGLGWALRRRTVTQLSIAYLPFFFLDLMVLAPGASRADRLLQSTVHLILFTVVVKVLSARHHRDYGYLAALSFLTMLASAVLTVGTIFIVGFTLYLLAAVSTFLSYEMQRASEAAANLKTQVWETPFRPRIPSPQSRAALERALVGISGAAGAGILLLALVLFFVIPRGRSRAFMGIGVQQQNLTGFSQSVDLGDLRAILRSNAVVMRVAVDGSPLRFQGVKWRGLGLTSFDGRHWYDDNTSEFPLEPVSQGRFIIPGLEKPPSTPSPLPREPLRYHVLLSPVSTDVLFVAAVPRELDARLRLVTLDQTGSLHNGQHGSLPLSYGVASDTGLPSPAELRRASTAYGPELRRVYLILPPLNPRIGDLARRLTGSSSNNYDRAVAIQDYLRSHYGYTLDPVGLDPADPVGSFLFKVKKGYCEYFAAAMAVMLRTLGIPSRLVNGFATGTYNPVGRDFIVRARDAHSWVEVYFPGFGWISFDPTPADPDAGQRLGALDGYVDAASLFWNEWVINYDSTHQMRLARQVETDSRQLDNALEERLARLERAGTRRAAQFEQGLGAHQRIVLALAATLLGLPIAVGHRDSVAAIRLIWMGKLKRKESVLEPPAAALLYRELLHILARQGFGKPVSQTPLQFSLSLSAARTPPAWARPLADFTRLYNEARFGGRAVSLGKLCGLLKEIKQGGGKNVSPEQPTTKA